MPRQPLSLRPDYGESDAALPRDEDSVSISAARVAARFRMASAMRSLHKEAAVNALDGMPKRKAKDVVNRLMDPHTKGMFRDQYWTPINAIWSVLGKQDIPFAITRAEYEYDGDRSNGPVRKVWTFEIDFKNERGHADTLYGRITAAGAGSVADPLGVYDVTAYVS